MPFTPGHMAAASSFRGIVFEPGPLDPVLLLPVACLLVAGAVAAIVLSVIAWHLLRRRA